MTPLSLLAFRRILDTRRRLHAQTWAARSEVIRRQLVAMRQTYPA